jgi:hypothetical protein
MPCGQQRLRADQMHLFAASTLVGATGFEIGAGSGVSGTNGGPPAASCRIRGLLDHAC